MKKAFCQKHFYVQRKRLIEIQKQKTIWVIISYKYSWRILTNAFPKIEKNAPILSTWSLEPFLYPEKVYSYPTYPSQGQFFSYFIDFNNVSKRLRLLHASWLGNFVHYTFVFNFFCNTLHTVIYEVHTISFKTFFGWGFKITVDSWKFRMLLLYI